MADLKKLFRGEHPFITQPTTWVVAGHGMSGEPLNRLPIQGRVRITHLEDRIVNHGEMTIISRDSGSTIIPVSYDMTPTDDELVLTFHQVNEAVGDLTGKVVAFDDRLVSSYTSGDGSLKGCEVLHRMGENHYAVTGTLSSNGSLVNLWKLDMVRPLTDGTVPGEDDGSAG
jgi:hypothetical protein